MSSCSYSISVSYELMCGLVCAMCKNQKMSLEQNILCPNENVLEGADCSDFCRGMVYLLI